MLKNIPGTRIRRQYFNIPIYLVAQMDITLICIIASTQIQKGRAFSDYFGDIVFIIVFGAAIILPLAILSLLNRFYFGEIICVLDEKGVHYEDGERLHFIWYKDIRKVTYEPDIPTYSRCVRHLSYNCACIISKPYQKEIVTELDNAPFHLLRHVKRHAPEANYGFTGWGLTLVLFMVFLPVLATVIAIFTV